MKNIFLLFFFGIFICHNVFSQSDSARKKLFHYGIKTDLTVEPYNKLNYEDGFRINNMFNLTHGTFSFDPALVLLYKKNSLSIGPKVFFTGGLYYEGDLKWRGLRVNYQYTFINPKHNCNLFLFYDFAYACRINEFTEGIVYDGPSYTYNYFKIQFINHEIGVGGRWKWSDNFYFNFCYGFGINSEKWSGREVDTVNNIEIRNWRGGSLSHINRLTGFLRVGLQYDFNL